MQKSTLSWDDLLTLSTLERSGSYAQAARELGLTHATVIRRLRKLEAALGLPVLTRAEGAFVLTPAGHNALAAARQMEQAAQHLQHQLDSAGSGVAGQVRIAVTGALGVQVLAPALPALLSAHPQLEVRLELDDRIASLARRRAHIGVRLARPEEPGVVAQRVGQLGFGLYRAHATVPTPATPLCGLIDAHLPLPEVDWSKATPRRLAFQANSLLAVREAVAAGAGMALLPHYLASTDGRLVLDQAVPQVQRELWLAYPPEFRDTPRFAPVLDWLRATLARIVN